MFSQWVFSQDEKKQQISKAYYPYDNLTHADSETPKMVFQCGEIEKWRKIRVITHQYDEWKNSTV